MSNLFIRSPNKVSSRGNAMKSTFLNDSFTLYDQNSSGKSSPRSINNNRVEESLNSLEAMIRQASLHHKLPSSSASSCVEENEDEYGFYEDCEEAADNAMSIDNDTNSSHGSSSSGSSEVSESSSSYESFPSSSSSSIVCMVEDSKAPMACRSFERSDSQANVAVCVALGGLRIVHNGYSEEAEYKVRLYLDGREYVAWKTYRDFLSLGRACSEYTSNKRKQGSQGLLEQTVRGWQSVEQHRPWFGQVTRDLQHLLQESTLLEHFMKNLLFEIPCVNMLVEFVLT